jgi:hypothetical protein
MRTLASIIKTPRRIARDTREKFADADEFFDGGIDTLARFLSENISDDDLESLRESIRMVLYTRVRDQITGPMATDSAKGFASRYPAARNIKRIA